jgi:hypothetical protein
MDYPLFNLLFGLALVLANTLSAVLVWSLVRVARGGPRSRVARLSALALALSLLLSLFVGLILVQQMLPATRWQLALGAGGIAGLGALAAWLSAQVPLSGRAVRLVFALQLLSSAAAVVVALGLWRSLAPLAP